MSDTSQVCPHDMMYMNTVTIGNEEFYRCACGYTVKVIKRTIIIPKSEKIHI